MSLFLITGPMYSGKTFRLFQTVRRMKFTNENKSVVLKWNKDLRGGELSGPTKVYTHGDSSYMGCFRVKGKLNNPEVLKLVKGMDVIGIDDGQFFPDIFEFCKLIINSSNTMIVVSALDTDFRREGFAHIIKLITIANVVKKLRSACNDCKGVDNAIFSYRLSDSKELVDIGGINKYIALCRPCFNFRENPIKYTIGVMGNIGSGKSTLCENLKRYFNEKFDKPLKKFANFYGNCEVIFEEPNQDKLKRFYDNPKENWFWFQCDMVYSRLLKMSTLKKKTKGLTIIDRLPIEDQIFPKTLLATDVADIERYDIYMKLYKLLMEGSPSPDVYIFLEVSPEKCFENVIKRSCGAETKLTLDYCKTLGIFYDHLKDELIKKFSTKKEDIKKYPGLTVVANKLFIIQNENYQKTDFFIDIINRSI